MEEGSSKGSRPSGRARPKITSRTAVSLAPKSANSAALACCDLGNHRRAVEGDADDCRRLGHQSQQALALGVAQIQASGVDAALEKALARLVGRAHAQQDTVRLRRIVDHIAVSSAASGAIPSRNTLGRPSKGRTRVSAAPFFEQGDRAALRGLAGGDEIGAPHVASVTSGST